MTDPGATRFFMTAAEAASLVLKAAISGPAGEVFWLDMGSPLRLRDLVERDSRRRDAAGRRAAAIVVIGLRPGEKRNEELTTMGLTMEATHDPGVWRARQPAAETTLVSSIEALGRACEAGDAAQVLRVVETAVPDYRPSAAARDAARPSSRSGRLLAAAARAARDFAPGLCRLA